MSTYKRSIKKSVRSRRSSNASSLCDTSSSETENERSEIKSLKSRKLAKKSTYSFLDDLRQANNSVTPRTVISIELQLATAVLIQTIVGYLVMEPLLPDNLTIFSTVNNCSKKHHLLSTRLANVFQNSCFSLMWVLFSELYKVYLRTVSDIRNIIQSEISLSEQIKINNRIKMAEHVHIRSLSQFVLIIVCQLNFVFHESLSQVLYRAVPAFNLFYLLSRLADSYQPKRLRIFSHAIIYVPVVLCFGYIIYWQTVKAVIVIIDQLTLVNE